VLDDRQRADDHLAAIRALSATALSDRPNKEKKALASRIAERLEKSIRDGDAELLAPAMAALARITGTPYSSIISDLVKSETVSPERAKALQQLDESQILDEMNMMTMP